MRALAGRDSWAEDDLCTLIRKLHCRCRLRLTHGGSVCLERLMMMRLAGSLCFDVLRWRVVRQLFSIFTYFLSLLSIPSLRFLFVPRKWHFKVLFCVCVTGLFILLIHVFYSFLSICHYSLSLALLLSLSLTHSLLHTQTLAQLHTRLSQKPQIYHSKYTTASPEAQGKISKILLFHACLFPSKTGIENTQSTSLSC